jgi:hypothetical protein
VKRYELKKPWVERPPRKRVLTDKERALAEWRRIDLTQQEIALKDSAKGMAQLLPKVLKEIGFDQREMEVQIVKVWNHLMEPAVRDHAQPVGLAKGTLFVNVDSNAWLDEIVRYRRKEILTRLQHAFGRDLIGKISFRVG